MMLINDHMRIKRMFRGFTRWTGDHDLAMAISYELTAHAAIEEEILYPFLRQVDARLADHAEEEHAEVKALIAKLEDMDPDSKSLRPTVLRLKFNVDEHVEEEERKIFPLLLPYKQELFDMGRQMTTRTQELLVNRNAPKALTRLATSNTGWGRTSSSRSDMANAGW